MINNYFKPGPGTNERKRLTSCSISNKDNSPAAHPELYGLMSCYYINGNYMDGYGQNYDWKGVRTDTGLFIIKDSNNYYGHGYNAEINIKLLRPFHAGIITTHTAETAFKKVLTYAGASFKRDRQDIRYANETLNGTATYRGSVTKRAGIIDIVADQGSYEIEEAVRNNSFDTDHDGIPDIWENANGLDAKNPNDANEYSVDTLRQYTNIEVYANSLVQDIMLAENADAIITANDYYPAYTNEAGIHMQAINRHHCTEIDNIVTQNNIQNIK